jgi:hypothetical protein
MELKAFDGKAGFLWSCKVGAMESSVEPALSQSGW